jgi:4-amino-4-deoxy-L-arabinose transferase-like glycosyltransferase
MRRHDEAAAMTMRRPVAGIASGAWLLIAIVLVYCCVFQGVRPIYSPDEGRYTNVALAMLDDGDWIHPMLHHEVEHWSKPPLTYWTIASAIALAGRNEWAARLPGALAFACTILVLMRLGRTFVPSRPWLPGLVYATFVLPSLAANLVTTDSLLALWESLIVASFVELWHAADRAHANRSAYVLGTCAALAFMTKGPPGLLTLFACLVFATWSEGWPGLRRATNWRMLIVFAALGLTWFAVVVSQDPRVLRYFLVDEVVQRIATDKMHRNASWFGAVKIYAPTLIVGTLPWLPVLIVGAWRDGRHLARRIRSNAAARLLACWIGVPLCVFVIARSRLPLYLLPIFAPLALVVARQLENVHVRAWHRAAIAIWCGLLIAARIVPAWIDAADDDRRLADGVAALARPVPDEVAFVESAPRFGLRFYLGSEVERIRLPDGFPQPESQDLASELAEQEGCRLLVTEARLATALSAALTDRDVRFERLADVRGYATFAQFTPDCRWVPGAL